MERITVYANPNCQVTEAYRNLCTSVLAGLKGRKLVEIVAVSQNSNISTVIANLAVALAQTGEKVLLVDCNLRAPKQHDIFMLQNSGLIHCIKSGEDYKSFVKTTDQPNLYVLPAGGSAINPIETLLSLTTDSILTEAKDTYDVVLLDVPPVDGVSDAVALGTKTDGVLLVLTNKQDKVKQVQKAKELFIHAGVSILGCVLDKV